MEERLHTKTQEIFKMSEIGIWLDDYEDIFSDFDPRPFSVRTLSDDFLLAAKKGAKEKPSGSIELKLLIPTSKRHVALEGTIKNRLLSHFKKHYNTLLKERDNTRKNGGIVTGFGLLLLAAITYVLTTMQSSQSLSIVASIVEPAGWFTTWFGLDKIFYGANQKKGDLDFYEKMSKVKISFVPY